MNNELTRLIQEMCDAVYHYRQAKKAYDDEYDARHRGKWNEHGTPFPTREEVDTECRLRTELGRCERRIHDIGIMIADNTGE